MNTRPSLIAIATITALLGAGCSSKTSENKIQPEQAATTKMEFDTQYCTAEPQENDIGSIVYPIAPAYWNMPHLGQIFTALDCKNSDRANKIQWMKDGNYTAGITLSWGDARPSEKMRSLLIEIGFTETTPGLWQNKSPVSLNNLDRLRLLFQKSQQGEILESEDCMDCG